MSVVTISSRTKPLGLLNSRPRSTDDGIGWDVCCNHDIGPDDCVFPDVDRARNHSSGKDMNTVGQERLRPPILPLVKITADSYVLLYCAGASCHNIGPDHNPGRVRKEETGAEMGSRTQFTVVRKQIQKLQHASQTTMVPTLRLMPQPK